MSYPEFVVAPMRKELTDVGFQELTNAQAVNAALSNDKESILVVINSVCGCAAANARPAVRTAINNAKKPAKLATVFAGVDVEAVNKVREYLMPYPPSSPAIALFKGGKLVHMIERHQIEGRPAQMIADNLIDAFERHC